MKNYVLTILLAIILSGCSARQESRECINFDALELIHDQFLFDGYPHDGCARKSQGKYVIEFQLVDGKKNGPVRQYKDNILIEEGFFRNNLLEGAFKTYFTNGHLESITHYKHDLKDGESRTYWQTGEIGHLCHYAMDQLVDTSYSYDKSGKKLARSIHHPGFGNSEVINYLDSTQTNFMSGSMRKGKSVGNWIYKFSSDSCFIRHYDLQDAYIQTPCDCDTLTIPKI